MLTTTKIETILENELSIRQWPRTRIHGIASAAIAIASHFTRAYAASLFVGLVNSAMRQYTVPGLDGAVHLVQLSSEPRCWQKYSGALRMKRLGRVGISRRYSCGKRDRERNELHRRYPWLAHSWNWTGWVADLGL